VNAHASVAGSNSESTHSWLQYGFPILLLLAKFTHWSAWNIIFTSEMLQIEGRETLMKQSTTERSLWWYKRES